MNLRPLLPSVVSISLLACLPLAGRSAEATVPLYKQPGAPVEQRVEDLLARMTPREKLAQISGEMIPGFKKTKPKDEILDEVWLQKKLADGIGTIGPCHLPLADDVRARNLVKDFLKNRTRTKALCR